MNVAITRSLCFCFSAFQACQRVEPCRLKLHLIAFKAQVGSQVGSQSDRVVTSRSLLISSHAIISSNLIQSNSIIIFCSGLSSDFVTLVIFLPQFQSNLVNPGPRNHVSVQLGTNTQASAFCGSFSVAVNE